MAHARKMAQLEVEQEVPSCIHWDTEQVAQWLVSLGYAHYVDCFRCNFISGRKLILLQLSDLPKIGITDFHDMKTISRAIHKLLKQDSDIRSRCVSLPHRNRLGLYLDQKSRTGERAYSLSYGHFLKANNQQLNKLFWK